MPRPYAVIVAALAGLLLTLTGPPPTARAADNGTWAVFPTPPRPTTVIKRRLSSRRKLPISAVSTWRS